MRRRHEPYHRGLPAITATKPYWRTPVPSIPIVMDEHGWPRLHKGTADRGIRAGRPVRKLLQQHRIKDEAHVRGDYRQPPRPAVSVRLGVAAFHSWIPTRSEMATSPTSRPTKTGSAALRSPAQPLRGVSRRLLQQPLDGSQHFKHETSKNRRRPTQPLLVRGDPDERLMPDPANAIRRPLCL